MTLDELYKALKPVLPDAAITEDYFGQLIIYTNLYKKGEDSWG